MEIWHAFVFALAVSLDGFGVGLSYGIRRIIIPAASLLIICLTSALAITLSMLGGSLFANLISPALADRIGSMIIILVGIWIIIQAYANIKGEKRSTEGSGQQLVNVKIPVMGIVVQILREPVQADMDSSGVISIPEAMMLGLALAMDALGAGFGAAVAGFYLWLVPLLVGLLKLVLVSSGLYLGQRWHFAKFGEKSAVLPGLILIVLGIIRI